MKVYIIGNYRSYAKALDTAEVVQNMDQADLVILTGGEDVTPYLYDEIKHPTTMINIARDSYEVTRIRDAIKLGLPILGICRGSQLSTVASGGKLIQHVQGHPYIHEVYDTVLDERYEVTSTHHQMMYPFNMPKENYKIIAYATNLTKSYEGLPEGANAPNIDPEIVYYPNTRMLAVQGHPEFSDAPDRFKEVINLHVKKLINNEF